MSSKRHNNKSWSVYIHTNKLNGKMYIGSTSRNPEDRWGKGGVHYKDQPFYKYIQEYGWDNFSHDVIATGLSTLEASNLEKSLIIKYKSLLEQNGYNSRVRGLDDNTVPYDTKVCELNNHGNLIKIYNNTYEAAFEKNINPVNIYNAACKNGYSCGRVWRFLLTDLQTFKEDIQKNFNWKDYDGLEPVYMYSKEGKFLNKFDNAARAGDFIFNNKEGNSSAGTSILSACRVDLSNSSTNKNSIRFGYVWRFECDVNGSTDNIDTSCIDFEFANSKVILQFSLEKVLENTYRNRTVLQKTTNFEQRSVCESCRTHVPYLHKLWMFEDDYKKLGYVPFKTKGKKAMPVIVFYPDKSYKVYLSLREVLKYEDISGWEFDKILNKGIPSKSSGKIFETLKTNSKEEYVWNIPH